MFGLAGIGIAAAKFAGVHLLPHVIPGLKKSPGRSTKLAGSGVSTLEGVAFGLGLPLCARLWDRLLFHQSRISRRRRYLHRRGKRQYPVTHG